MQSCSRDMYGPFHLFIVAFLCLLQHLPLMLKQPLLQRPFKILSMILQCAGSLTYLKFRLNPTNWLTHIYLTNLLNYFIALRMRAFSALFNILVASFIFISFSSHLSCFWKYNLSSCNTQETLVLTQPIQLTTDHITSESIVFKEQ